MIKAVMFDMGGTLEDLYSEEKNDRATAYALYDILQKHHIQVPYEAEALWAIVGAGIQAYKKDSERTLMELKPEQIWCDWGFKDVPVDREKLAEISEEIAHMWETTFYDRSLREHAAEMLRGLKEDLGLHVAVVSNTGSLFQVSTRSPCPPSWATASPIPTSSASPAPRPIWTPRSAPSWATPFPGTWWGPAAWASAACSRSIPS